MSQTPTDVAGTVAATADIPTSERHRLLATERRRVILAILADRTAPVDLEELAAATAALEADGNGADAETVEQVALTLHHAHLPMMAELGVLDYDAEATRVESCPHSPESGRES